MYEKILFVLLCVFSFSVSAATHWGGQRKVIRIVYDEGGQIYLEVENAQTLGGPKCQSGTLLLLKSSHNAFDQMHASVLAAFHSGHLLEAFISVNCSKGGTRVITRMDAFAS